MDRSTRITRSEVVDLYEAIYDTGPLPAFGARALTTENLAPTTQPIVNATLPQC